MSESRRVLDFQPNYRFCRVKELVTSKMHIVISVTWITHEHAEGKDAGHLVLACCRDADEKKNVSRLMRGFAPAFALSDHHNFLKKTYSNRCQISLSGQINLTNNFLNDMSPPMFFQGPVGDLRTHQTVKFTWSLY